MNKRFFTAAFAAALILACHGIAHARGGFGGGFHGGGAHFAAPHFAAPHFAARTSPPAHFAAPHFAAPMLGGFHGGPVGGFRAAGPGVSAGPRTSGPRSTTGHP